MPVVGLAAERVSLDPAEQPPNPSPLTFPQASPHAYAEKTDTELTELTAQWDSLDDTQRRALLTEVKMRMARSKGRDGVIRIRTLRRYGRIIRKSDGSVVRIETRVVRVRPARPGTQSYGVGFEQRAARKEAGQETPPVLTVKGPSP
jgi:hypothetical protein